MARYYSTSLLLAGCLLLLSACQAAAPAAKSAMELDKTYPDMSTGIKAIRNNNADLAAYLSDPDSVCTLFVPTNKAMTDWMKWFGKYAGKAVQNVTFMTDALNYHVIPGKALTGEQVSKGGKQLTRANQTVYFWKQGGKPRVYTMPDFPVALNRSDIKAGKCIVHSIDMALVPPTSRNMVVAWMDELGTKPKPGPKSQWAPEQEPLPNSLEAKAAAAAAGATTAPAPAPAAKKSSAAGRASTGVAGLVLGFGAVAVAAVL